MEVYKSPNPGSDAAVAMGCKCHILDNHHGKGFPWTGEDGSRDKPKFWINTDCPIHNPDKVVKDAG